MTHAGVDGYTRRIVYIGCSDNNRSETVYSLFLRGIFGFLLEFDAIEGVKTVR